ncbi:MAG TPA: homoserine dehydrogenase [Stenomitos sp.]
MGFKIGLLGLGTVGSGVAAILQDRQGRHPLLQAVELYRVGLRSPDKPRSVELPPEAVTTDLNAIVSDPEVDVVVEVIGGLEPARSLILQAIAHGKHVVTANKAVISRYGDEIFTAANQAGVYVMIEAAVAGGIPVIQPMKQSMGANRITCVMGILNGTTNYILTQMQESGRDFADILADAQRLGYAEADPTADVDGLDAGDKIAILASLAFGGRIKLEDVHREGIRHVSASDINYADKLGFVIKLLAIAKHAEASPSNPTTSDASSPLQVRVHATLVPKHHPLASVNDVYNAILLEGEPLGQVMFFGPGAGAGPTASAVVSDVINVVALLKTGLSAHDPDAPLMHPLLSCAHHSYSDVEPIENLNTRFYVRFLTKDHPGVIGHLGTSFGRHGVSLESLVQTGFQGDLAEIVVVTHSVREGDFRTALAEIQALEAVDSIPSILRVL